MQPDRESWPILRSSPARDKTLRANDNPHFAEIHSLHVRKAAPPVAMLKRFQVTVQAKAGDDEGRSLDVDGKCVRTDPQHRDLARNPFFGERY